MNTADRIFKLLDEAGMEQKKFAEAIGTTDKVVSKWRTAGLKSYHKYLPQIAEVLHTTVDYLVNGDTSIVVAMHGVPPQDSYIELLDLGQTMAATLVDRIRDLISDDPNTIERISSKTCQMAIEVKIFDPETTQHKKPIILADDGQAEKLARALSEIGIDVDKLSDAELNLIARLAKAALE